MKCVILKPEPMLYDEAVHLMLCEYSAAGC